MEKIKKLIKRILKITYRITLLSHEYKTKEKIKYLFYKRNSKILCIVFSGFDLDNSFRAYNYVRSLSDIKLDFLYISDQWGWRGSYYVMENGKDYPIRQISEIINEKLKKNSYNKIITLGTSKGGSAALFYGLKLKASHILIGACQYKVGTYLSFEPKIFKAMTGQEVNIKDITLLNKLFSDQVRDHQGTKSEIHLIHSKKEPTYEKHIQFLIEDLIKYKYNLHEYESGFKEHNEISKYFKPVVRNILLNLSQE